ncbi:MAG: hypothetical protein ABI193_06085, partial [Minicystis sp.]
QIGAASPPGLPAVPGWPPIWNELTFELGEDMTSGEARSFTRLLNQPEGQAFFWKIAESLVQLRRTTKRRRDVAPRSPVVDPTTLPCP